MVQEKDDKSLDLGFNLEVELLRGFPADSVVKNPPANSENVRDTGLIHGSGRSPGEGDGSPFQYSCLENSMDRGAWWTIVHGMAEESDTT